MHTFKAAICGVLLTVGSFAVTSRAATPEVSLAQRATRLGDVAEIKRLQAIYGYYIDRSMWDEILDLLTDDATLEYGSSGVYVGKAQARALLYGIGYGQYGLIKGQLRDHTQLQPVITLAPDGRTALGRWHALVILGQFQQYARWQTGPYENEYRKENGRWKISRLHWYETFTVPYKGGWKGSMPQSNVADRRLPAPDRPPSFKYDVWPAVSLPPYHYANPGTTPLPAPTPEASSVSRADVAQRVQRLEDERDILDLQKTYGYYVDKNLWPEVTSLFAADATLEIGGRGVFVGHQRILQYLRYLGAPQDGRLYDHTQMQPVVHVTADGRAARGRWRALIFAAETGARSVIGDAIYENEYRKEGGRWKIAKLHAWFILYANVDQGWESEPLPNTRPEKDLPPDRPPTVVYDMYPGTLTAPFHYRNPLRGDPLFETSASSARASTVNLDQRIARLEDADSIERLQNAYGFYVNKRQWDEVAKLFARDARYETAQRGVYVGVDRIRKALELEGPQGLQRGEFNDHIQYQQITRVAANGTTARSRVRELALTGRFGQEARLGGGTAENEYVKENGLWKIRSLHQYTRFVADYEKGWSEAPLTLATASQELPPDRPPTVKYGAFPTYYIPPITFPNPVTGRTPKEGAY
ncbi:MAG: nuclear transport factor 2 family protein [Steroidobacteraceae bacterium]